MRVTKKTQLETGALLDPSPDNYRCEQCQLFRQTSKPFNDWPPEGPPNSTVIISGAPIDSDDQLWHDIRQRVYGDSGLTDESAVFLKPTLCQPRRGKATALQLRMCQPFIDRSLSELQPKRILAMGASAVRQVAGEKATITAMIGADTKWNMTPLHVTYDPMQAFADMPQTLVTIQRHVRRMMKGLKKKLPKFPGYKKELSKI